MIKPKLDFVGVYVQLGLINLYSAVINEAILGK